MNAFSSSFFRMADPVGDRPTITDVATAAGVSPMMVSRVLNGGSVSSAKRAVIERTIRTLGYRPNEAARRLARRSRQRVKATPA